MLAKDLRTALGPDLDLHEVEMALEEIRDELRRGDGEPLTIPEDQSTVRSFRAKKPLIERIDET